jgi:hypothetical protein
MKELPILGETVHQALGNLVTIYEEDLEGTVYEKKSRLMEQISQLIIEELRRQGLSDSPSDFLLNHGPEVQSKIKDPQIRGIDVWAE